MSSKNIVIHNDNDNDIIDQTNNNNNNDISEYKLNHHFDDLIDDHHHHVSHSNDDELSDYHHIPDIQDYDPKIRDLLDDLNRYSTKINQLELCFQEENSRFHRILNESSIELNQIMKKCGERHIIVSRPYYEALQKSNDLKLKCQTAALKFEKYNELYLDAKQSITNAESMYHKTMKDDGHFDQYWQEKLNIANAKFIETKAKREEYEQEHLSLMTQIRVNEYNIVNMRTKYKNSIKKAKPYFDEKANIDSKLKKKRDDTKLLEEELAKCKKQYSITLKQLENISEEIHEKRAHYLSKSLKREPGVGAEIIESNDVENCLMDNMAKLNLGDSTPAIDSISDEKT